LKEVSNKIRNSEYNPKRFGAVIVKLRDPKASCLVFRNGKLVISGAKSVLDSELAGKRIASAIKRATGAKVSFKDFKVLNMVASASLDFEIALERLYTSEHQDFCRYQPEKFAGLTYYMEDPKVCVLLFKSGKVVLTGAKK